MILDRKQKICALLKAIETGDSAAVAVVDEDKYIQHNPQTHEGSEGLAALFEHLAPSAFRLYPEALADQIDALNERLYETLNNGVYRAGFASTQEAYDEAVKGVFRMLDELLHTVTQVF